MTFHIFSLQALYPWKFCLQSLIPHKNRIVTVQIIHPSHTNFLIGSKLNHPHQHNKQVHPTHTNKQNSTTPHQVRRTVKNDRPHTNFSGLWKNHLTSLSEKKKFTTHTQKSEAVKHSSPHTKFGGRWENTDPTPSFQDYETIISHHYQSICFSQPTPKVWGGETHFTPHQLLRMVEKDSPHTKFSGRWKEITPPPTYQTSTSFFVDFWSLPRTKCLRFSFFFLSGEVAIFKFTPHQVIFKKRNCEFTNHQNKGLISADRGTKATLMLTIPRSLFKSYTKDLSFPIFELCFSIAWGVFGDNLKVPLQCYDLGREQVSPIRIHYNIGKAALSGLSSMDSGLEAFSRNPTHGSFSALTFQSTEFANLRTNGSSRTKLDYCHLDNSISRVKLTCLTTV